MKTAESTPSDAVTVAERSQLLGLVLANIDAYVYLKDNNGFYLYANEKVLHLYGRSAEEVIGRHDLDLMRPEVAGALIATDKWVLESKARHACEEVVVGADGKARNFWSIKLPLERPGHATCLIGFSTDITELLELRQTLERQRTTDALTGLANRVQFEEDLALELRIAERGRQQLAVALLDLDQFKYINSHLGKDAGD
ncbi:MAG TPA: diguanylate cyclase, partial [Burkholderiaceae bacterium]